MSVDEEGFERLMAEQRERARKAPARRRDRAGRDRDLPARQRGSADHLRRLRAPRGLQHGARRSHTGRRQGGSQARRVALLRRGRRPGRRRGLDPHRLRQARCDRRLRFENDQVIVGRLTEGSVFPASAPRPWSTPCGATRRPATIPPPTCFTTPCASCSATTCVRPARWSRPDRLRFDYKTRRAPTPAELRQIEDLANRRIVENHPVRPFVTTREYAAEIGALAFFEEKYGEFVRVLEIDEFSRELCGGTHVSSTSADRPVQDHRQHLGRRQHPARRSDHVGGGDRVLPRRRGARARAGR